MLLGEKYNQYVADTISFVSTIIIKLDYTARALNSHYKALGIDTPLNPLDWIYYKNIAGQKCIINGVSLNAVITISSIETGALVEYSLNLKDTDPHTYELYKTDTTLLNSLIELYPDEEMYIRGVAFPVDPNLALAAPDFTILAYDNTKLNYNETNIIPNLQKWLYNFSKRWYNDFLNLSDNWYSISFLATLYSHLPHTIINLRLENCKTEFVHPFHLWNYLNGYFEIDRFKNVIPYEQALFLYRNIEYITHDAGKTSTLDFLNSGFALPFGLTLFSLKYYRDDKQRLANFLANNYNELDSGVYFKRDLYNADDSLPGANNSVSTDYVVNKLLPLGTLNPNYKIDDLDDLNSLWDKTSSNIIETGLIECAISSQIRDSIVNKNTEQLNYLIYLITNNLYEDIFFINIPNIGVYNIELKSRDALALIFYCAGQIYGTPMTSIPTIYANDIILPNPNMDTFLGGVETDAYSGIRHYGKNTISWNWLTEIANSLVFPKLILNKNELNLFIEDICNCKFALALVTSHADKETYKAELRSIIDSYFVTVNCTLVSDVTYANLFKRLNVDLTGLTPKEYYETLQLLIDKFLYLDTTSSPLPSPYYEMVEILKILTSYLVQYITGDNLDNSVNLDYDSYIIKYDSSGVGIDIQMEFAELPVKTVSNNSMNEFEFNIIAYDIVTETYATANTELEDTTDIICEDSTISRVDVPVDIQSITCITTEEL